MIVNALKIIWRFSQSIKLRKDNVFVSSRVLFNKNTTFENFIKISEGVCISNSNVGRNTYIGAHTNLPNCQIGRFCSISDYVVLVDYTHPTHFVSTCPSFFSTIKQNGQSFVKINNYNERLSIGTKSVVIGNDVWIGSRVLIKGGVTIGDGAIVGMGSIVTKDIPPYAIAVGVPAKIIRYRFEDEIIKQLLQSQWWNESDDWLYRHSPYFSDVNFFLSQINSNKE